MSDEVTTETTTVTTTPAPAASNPPPAASGPDPAITALIDLARQQPGVVPELISGATAEEVAASIKASQATYTSIRQQIAAELAGEMPGGAGSTRDAAPPDPGYPTIIRGLEKQQKQK